MKETILKVNKATSWFFEKINKIDKHLDRLIKKKRKKNQINKVRSEKGVVITDNVEIQRIIRDYYEQLYGNKMGNLGEIDTLLEQFNLPRLNQEKIEIMSNPIENGLLNPYWKWSCNKKISKKKKKSPGPDGFRR